MHSVRSKIKFEISGIHVTHASGWKDIGRDLILLVAKWEIQPNDFL